VQAVERLRRGVMHLCQNSSSIKAYNAELPNMERPMRVAVLQNASFGPHGFHVACNPTEDFVRKKDTYFR